MNLVTINWKPTARQLMQFGLIAAGAIPFFGWMWGASPLTLIILAVVGSSLALAGLIRPQALRYLFLALSLVGLPIGLLMGELLMLVSYYGLFLPIGLLFRLIGRDALQLKLDRNDTSYWQPKQQPDGSASYLRQS
jgi:hypothetical protein